MPVPWRVIFTISYDSGVHIQHIIYDVDDLHRFRMQADGILPTARRMFYWFWGATMSIFNLIRPR